MNRSRYLAVLPYLSAFAIIAVAVLTSDHRVSLPFFVFVGLCFAYLMRSEQRAKNELERELTERKRIEAELQASQDQFYKFVENGLFAAFIKDERGAYVFVNKFVERNFGRERADYLGKTDGEIYPADLAKEYVENDHRALSENASVPFDETSHSPDGAVRYWSTIKFPLRDADGRQLLGGIAVDVSEIRKAERQAKESEDRLLLALEAGRMGIWLWDLATNRVQSSETQAKIHGRLPEQTETRIEDSYHHIHPDDRASVRQVIESAMRNEAPDRTTYRVVWPDGSIHWVEAIGRVSCDASGVHTQVTGVCVDITERKHAENALRESEERFRLLAMHAPVGIVLCDAEGRTLFANPKVCELADALPEEVMGFDWQTFIHPDDRQGLLEAWRSDIAAGKIHSSGEFRFVRKDGSIRWASSTASLVHDANGTPIGQIGITLDITERKAAEDRLRTREAQLGGILDNTTAVVYLKDSEGRFQLINHRFESIFQALGQSFIGKNDTEVFPEPLARKFLESDAQVWREQIAHTFEEDAPHADGLHTYRSVKFPVRDATGKMIALGGISTDITDLKEAYEALRKKEELLRNLIEVQESEKRFLCHEFHDGLIQYAVASLMALETHRQKQLADVSPIIDTVIIDTVIGNLRRGVDDGRRVIRGIRPAVLDDSDLPAAIEDLIGQFETSGMHVTGKCDPEIGRLPEAIQTTIYRVVQEALNNAKNHSGTDVVRIELKKTSDGLHLEVRDFGSGFDVRSSRKQGFGLLGMAERVRLHGGDLNIDSEPDVGTRISVRLPIP
ncbi:MAG: PAS domain S-box protein [Planctomycetia bacterium]|nr:PAS domain S-box protein [Planctomycetia bacterium]